MVHTKKNLMWLAATTIVFLFGLSQASFLNTPRGGYKECDKSCMSYCVAYYPTSGCLEVCGCAATELGRALY